MERLRSRKSKYEVVLNEMPWQSKNCDIQIVLYHYADNAFRLLLYHRNKTQSTARKIFATSWESNKKHRWCLKTCKNTNNRHSNTNILHKKSYVSWGLYKKGQPIMNGIIVFFKFVSDSTFFLLNEMERYIEERVKNSDFKLKSLISRMDRLTHLLTFNDVNMYPLFYLRLRKNTFSSISLAMRSRTFSTNHSYMNLGYWTWKKKFFFYLAYQGFNVRATLHRV